MGFFSSKSVGSKCYVFYSVEYDRKMTKELYSYLLDFFGKMKIDFKFGGFYDETYSDRYGRREKIRAEMDARRWNEIAHFALDDEDMRKSERKVAIEFNISRVFLITVVLNNDISFAFNEFLSGLDPLFKVAYGFSYGTSGGEWATAYANGDWQHTKQVPDVTRTSKEALQQWNEKSEAVRFGLMRDVYLENVLSKVHLLFPLNEQTLEEYIQKNKGELIKAGENAFIWNIEKSSLGSIREDLYKSGIII
jgi:hypothetical protein